jgi:hypothetical protein
MAQQITTPCSSIAMTLSIVKLADSWRRGNSMRDCAMSFTWNTDGDRIRKLLKREPEPATT